MSTGERTSNKRRWVWRFLFVAFIWLVVTQFAEIEKLVLTASGGHIGWLVLAMVFQLFYYSLYSNVFRKAMRMLGVVLPWWIMLPSTFASMFVNVVAPLGGASGVAVFVDQAIRRKQSPARTAAGAMLALISDFSAFSLILITGLTFLFYYKDLKIYEVIAAALLLILTILMTSTLLLGLWNPALLRKLLEWAHRFARVLFGWFSRPSPLTPDWIDKTFDDFVGIGEAIRSSPKDLGKLFLVSFAAYSMDLVSLWMIFRAFGQVVHFGVLVAGFSMGILFWVITITPQGIGLVEGMMALVYTSLGVPANLATVIALTFRGLTFWLPFFLGFIFLQVLPTFRGESRTEVRDWSVRIVALLTALAGVMNMISTVLPPRAWRIALVEKIFSIETYYGFYIITALAGFALLMLADGLWRRKQTAWRLTLIFLALSVFSNLFKGLDYGEALLLIALGVWLVILKPNFHAYSVHPPLQQGVRVLLAALGYICLYGIAGFYLLDTHFAQNYGLLEATAQLVKMFSTFRNPGVVALTPFGEYFSSSIYLVTGLVLVFVLIMLMRPFVLRVPANDKVRARARKVIEAEGKSSMAGYALLPDKLYCFLPGGSVIAYTVKGVTALVFGDPIGRQEDFAPALTTFLGQCEKKRWTPVFFQVRLDGLQNYKQAGLDTVRIGDEIILDLKEMNWDAQNAPAAVLKRLENLGYTAHFHAPPLEDHLVDDLQVVSDEWLTTMHLLEKRFSQGWFDESFIRQTPVVVAQDPEGRVVAFASLLTCRGERGIDLLRNFKDAEEGVRKFLLAAAVRQAQQEGYERFNFGFVAGGGKSNAHPDNGAVDYIAKHLDEVFSSRDISSHLDGFPVRFLPRFLAFPAGMGRRAALALVRADAGNEFIEDYLQDAWRRAWATRRFR
ncbi:MAG: lysylphosphatidylglycerol synthetase family protein [Anaerolineaceae bacterium]|nr:lysylphosphatidylglycerol synthetase family protein [Anaerolineaceae bacterium]